MLATEKYKLDFERASKTGRPVLILKKGSLCNCHDPNELTESEPNPYCEKCFGTGYLRNFILTENIRHEPLNDVTKNNSEILVYNSSINEKRIFFLPERHSFITTEDLIATIYNNEVLSVYKVVNKEIYNAEDFCYLEIVGSKINFIPNIKFQNPIKS